MFGQRSLFFNKKEGAVLTRLYSIHLLQVLYLLVNTLCSLSSLLFSSLLLPSRSSASSSPLLPHTTWPDKYEGSFHKFLAVHLVVIVLYNIVGSPSLTNYQIDNDKRRGGRRVREIHTSCVNSLSGRHSMRSILPLTTFSKDHPGPGGSGSTLISVL